MEIPETLEPSLVELAEEPEPRPEIAEPGLEPIDEFALDLSAIAWAAPQPRAAQPARAEPEEQASRDDPPPAPLATDDGGEVPARPLDATAPAYPLASRLRGEEGSLTLAIEVDAQGRVAGVRVSHSSGHARLDNAALAAARRWSFEPARRAGRPVASTFLLRITFRMRP